MFRIQFFALALAIGSASAQVALNTRDNLELKGFKTVETAIRGKETPLTGRVLGRTGYLGVFCTPHKDGVVVAEIEEDGPGEKAGLKVGDVIRSANSLKPKSQTELRDFVQGLGSGATVKLAITRGTAKSEITATLAATSRPMILNEERAVLGLSLSEATADGAPIRRITEGSPADKAGLKSGDLVIKVDGSPLADSARLDSILNEKQAGETVVITYIREGKEGEAKPVLDPPAPNPNSQTFSARNMWKKPTFRLAIVGIEYADVKHNDKITNKDWEDSLFSTGTYSNKESVTGQKVYGSMNDYYNELSVGALKVEGKVFDWVAVSKNRMDYSEGSGTSARSRGMLFGEAMQKIIDRDGEKALDGYDGVFFVYAGARVQTVRGGIYWPHRASYSFKGKSWPYFIVQEGGPRMTDISVMCHEFGHMLGLPDLYARPENPGSEGLGIWCAMSNQAGNGRPQHFGAWCKMQLGWLNPTVIDPTVPQKLILAPVNGSKTECYKILMRADGSEYLLVENRRKQGFDESLPAEGLLIWHVVGNRPILEESHGVEGPNGPRSYQSMVPYPSPSNNAFTPFTTPSSRSQLGGGLPVSITNIRQLPDGRVTFYIGYDFE
ncbi:MAG: M6 family metalloprotease domain-containing protein [Fimbriimonadaceae bacterium]